MGLPYFFFAMFTVEAQTDMKASIQGYIDNSTNHLIKNATTPSVTIDPKTGAVYAIYFRGENSGGNIYLERSDDMGKTFSVPVRVNDKLGDVQLDAQWSPPALGVGPNSQVYVVWYNANHSEPEKYPYGQVTMKFASSVDGGENLQSGDKSCAQ